MPADAWPSVRVHRDPNDRDLPRPSIVLEVPPRWEAQPNEARRFAHEILNACKRAERV
ncbi:MAG: hypothetical protein VW405_00765 [Rhodospirillaceae bacterium]